MILILPDCRPIFPFLGYIMDTIRKEGFQQPTVIQAQVW